MKYKEFKEKFYSGDNVLETNKSSDLKELEKMKKVLGDKAPKDIKSFQTMKYNKAKEYADLSNDHKTINAINKNKGIIDKERARQLYFKFKNDDIKVSDYFIEQFINREFSEKKGKRFDYETILNISKLKSTHIDTRNNREIIYVNKIAIIKEQDKFITLREVRISKHWKEI